MYRYFEGTIKQWHGHPTWNFNLHNSKNFPTSKQVLIKNKTKPKTQTSDQNPETKHTPPSPLRPISLQDTIISQPFQNLMYAKF